MPLFIKESFLYKFICVFLVNIYSNSFLKKIIDKCSVYVVNSAMYTSLNRYFNKKPYFIHSRYYKICNKFISFLDKIADFVNKILKKLFVPKNKKTIDEIKSIKNTDKLTICYIICNIVKSLLIGILFSYALIGFITNNLNMSALISLLVLTIIFSLFSLCLVYYRGSFLYKIYKSW